MRRFDAWLVIKAEKSGLSIIAHYWRICLLGKATGVRIQTPIGLCPRPVSEPPESVVVRVAPLFSLPVPRGHSFRPVLARCWRRNGGDYCITMSHSRHARRERRGQTGSSMTLVSLLAHRGGASELLTCCDQEVIRYLPMEEVWPNSVASVNSWIVAIHIKMTEVIRSFPYVYE